MSYLIFCGICFIALVIASYADKKNILFLVWMTIFILTLLAGMRGEHVGIDTTLYKYNFEHDFPYSWQFEEAGFRLISRILLRVFHTPIFLFVFFAFVTNALIIWRLWDFRSNASFPYMCFIYLTIYYIGTMNIMRQYVAVAIVFYFTRYLERKKYVLFILALIVATSIHMTSLLGMVFFVVYVWENASKKIKKLLIIPIVLFVIVAGYLIYGYEIGHIQNYFSKNIQNFNFTFIYRVICFLVALSLQKVYTPNIYLKNTKHYVCIEHIRFKNKESIFYACGLITASMGMFFTFLSRLGICYLMYEMVFWGKIVKTGKSKQLCLLLSIVYALYVFIIELLMNGSGVFPYYISV